MILKINSEKYGLFNIIIDNDLDKAIWDYKWSIAKHHTGSFYIIRQIKDKKSKKTFTIRLHREIIKAKPGQIVDHKNGNTLDNRIDNLRICSFSDNAKNRKTPKHNKCGYKGVYFDNTRNRYRAYITHNKKQIKLGSFKNVLDAAKAYNNAAIKYYKEFAKLNEIKENK